MVRRILSLLAVTMLLAAPALAKRAKTPALQPAAVLAEPKDGATKVIDVKKGENLMVLGKKGDWSQVMTDGGKKGWVKSSVVSAGGFDAVDPSSMEVAAAEGDTALAIRARPNPPRTVIIGVGGISDEETKRIADVIKKQEQGLRVLEVRTEKSLAGASPAGGLDGAKKLAAAKKADLVIALQSGTGDALLYEIVDVKNAKVLANGTAAKSATEQRLPADQVAAAVVTATAGLTKSPADAKPVATPAGDAATTKAPDAPAEAAKAAPTATPASKKRNIRTLPKRSTN